MFPLSVQLTPSSKAPVSMRASHQVDLNLFLLHLRAHNGPDDFAKPPAFPIPADFPKPKPLAPKSDVAEPEVKNPPSDLPKPEYSPPEWSALPIHPYRLDVRTRLILYSRNDRVGSEDRDVCRAD